MIHPVLSELCFIENYTHVHSILSTVQPNTSFQELKELCFTGVLIWQLEEY